MSRKGSPIKETLHLPPPVICTTTMIPEELLTSIFTHLAPSQLARTALVSKSFHRIIQPLLYSSIELLASSEDPSSVPRNPTHYISCSFLCRTLRSHPPFGSLIRSLTMEARHPSLFLEDLHATRAAGGPDVRFAQLTKLVLRHAQLKMPTLQSLLGMMPRLEVLDVDFECDAEPRDPYHAMYLDCSELGAALQVVKETLVELRVEVKFVTSAALEIENGGSKESGEGWGIKGRLGGQLKGLEELRRVDVPWSVLMGWMVKGSLPLGECLPGKLGVLVLSHDLGFFYNYEWDDDEVCVGKLVEYLGGWGVEGHLRELEVRFSGDWEDEDRLTVDWGLWRKVDERCKEIGCRLQLEGRDLQ